MLRHPWTTGEQASVKVIQGVDEKLAAFQQVNTFQKYGIAGACNVF